MPGRAKTSAGKIKMNLALDPRAAELLHELAADERSLGALVSRLILAEARYRREEELRARSRAHDRPASDLHDALDRLEASNARYNRLVGRMSAVIFEVAPDGTLLLVNDAVAAITGFEPEELADRGWQERLFSGELAEALRRHCVALAREDLDRYEVVIARKDGGRAVVELSTANHYAADGSLERIVGFAVDITQRKQAELEMAAAQEELRRARDDLERRVEESAAALAEASRALQEERLRNQSKQIGRPKGPNEPG